MAEDEARHVTFEQGLRRLEEIAARLDAADTSVQETIALLREGRGLEQSLRGYLDTAEGELREIEEGRNLPLYVVDGLAAGPGRRAPTGDDSRPDGGSG